MELSDGQMERIRKAEGSAEQRLGVAKQIIIDGALVTGGDAQGGRILSARGFPRNASMPGMSMRALVSSWKANGSTPTSGWSTDVQPGHDCRPRPIRLRAAI